MKLSRRPAVQIIVALCFALLLGASVTEDRPARQDDTKKSAWLHEVYVREASAYEFYLDTGKRQKLELRREPVMRWTSDADYHGEVYVWTHQGRAAIVGCIFSGPQGDSARRIMHEFHSLVPQPLVAGARGGSGWQPQEAGITLQPISDAPEPADNEARRLTQMRELARRFSAHMAASDSKWELRLLPQPIYRYERTDKDSSVVDGAVFTFVWTIGTDPEVLLVIEARRTDSGVQWHYAPARFTNREAWVKYQDREIWRVDAATVGIFDGVTSKRYGAFSVKTVPNPQEAR
jgi:hypothetical protein